MTTSALTSVPGWSLATPRLSFSSSMPGRASVHAYRGLRTHGPFDRSNVNLREGSLLFVFPEAERPLARRLAHALIHGVGNYPGFGRLFRVDGATGPALRSLPVATDMRDFARAGQAYREGIARWNDGAAEPDLAIVLVPRTERFEVQTPYYEAKAAFAGLAIPTQMVSAELLRDPQQFQWSVANIALAVFAKLGGIPWAVEAPSNDDDLVIGIGRADVGRENGRERHFGYAVTFVSNGIYRQTWSFTPTADEGEYEKRLQQAITEALASDLDKPARRLVIHLAKQAGRKEIFAAERAMKDAAVHIPVAFLRLDDTSLHDVADTGEASFAPAKGIVAALSRRRALLQTEELGPLGPSVGPLLIEMHRRSTVTEGEFPDLVAQVFRLAHANWRGFNAQSKPATLVYGEQLASLVGHLQDVASWNPSLLRSELRDRPWFL